MFGVQNSDRCGANPKGGNIRTHSKTIVLIAQRWDCEACLRSVIMEGASSNVEVGCDQCDEWQPRGRARNFIHNRGPFATEAFLQLRCAELH